MQTVARQLDIERASGRVTLRGQISAARVFGCHEPKAHAKQRGRAHPSSTKPVCKNQVDAYFILEVFNVKRKVIIVTVHVRSCLTRITLCYVVTFAILKMDSLQGWVTFVLQFAWRYLKCCIGEENPGLQPESGCDHHSHRWSESLISLRSICLSLSGRWNGKLQTVLIANG